MAEEKIVIEVSEGAKTGPSMSEEEFRSFYKRLPAEEAKRVFPGIKSGDFADKPAPTPAGPPVKDTDELLSAFLKAQERILDVLRTKAPGGPRPPKFPGQPPIQKPPEPSTPPAPPPGFWDDLLSNFWSAFYWRINLGGGARLLAGAKPLIGRGALSALGGGGAGVPPTGAGSAAGAGGGAAGAVGAGTAAGPVGLIIAGTLLGLKYLGDAAERTAEKIDRFGEVFTPFSGRIIEARVEAQLRELDQRMRLARTIEDEISDIISARTDLSLEMRELRVHIIQLVTPTVVAILELMENIVGTVNDLIEFVGRNAPFLKKVGDLLGDGVQLIGPLGPINLALHNIEDLLKKAEEGQVNAEIVNFLNGGWMFGPPGFLDQAPLRGFDRREFFKGTPQGGSP